MPLIKPTTSFDRDDGYRRFPSCTHSRLVVITLQLLFGVVWGIAWIVVYFTGSLPQPTIDPDAQDQISAAFDKVSIVFGVGVLVASAVIYGALRYNVYFVLLGMVYAIIQGVLVMILLSPILVEHLNFYIAGCVVFEVAFLQPHYNFVEEYANREPRELGDDFREEDNELFISDNGFS